MGVLVAPSVGEAQASELRLQQPERDPRMRHEPLLQLRPWQDEASQLRERHHVGGWRHVEQDRNLTEEIAAPQLCALFAVDTDLGFALQHHVKARAAETLSEDPLASVEPLLIERVGDRLELGPGQIAEQREAREGVGEFLSVQWFTLLR